LRVEDFRAVDFRAVALRGLVLCLRAAGADLREAALRLALLRVTDFRAAAILLSRCSDLLKQRKRPAPVPAVNPREPDPEAER
jgi:hypothetical protein